MKINVNNKEFDLVYSIRTNIMYENIVNESLDYTQLSNITKISQLFYCNILASMQANKLPLELSWDEFITWLDENGGYTKLNDYALWLAKQIEIQANLIQKTEDNEDKKKVKKTKN